MEALTYEMVPIGKTFANSKLRNTWKFRLNGRVHQIDLKYSVITQKVELIVDNLSVRTWAHNSHTQLFTSAQIDGQTFEIAQIDQGFELYFQKQPFSFYKGRANSLSGSSGSNGTNGAVGRQNSIKTPPANGSNFFEYPNPPFIPNNALQGVLRQSGEYQIPIAPNPVPTPRSPDFFGVPPQPAPYDYNRQFSSSLLGGILHQPTLAQVNQPYNQGTMGFVPGIPTTNAPVSQYGVGGGSPVDPYGRKNSGGRRPIKIDRSCILEAQADSFLPIDFPVSKESHQMLFLEVHPKG